MFKNLEDGQNSVATSANKVYSTLEIINSEGETIYHNVGKLEDIKTLAEAAKDKFKSNGYKIQSITRGEYWTATGHNEYEAMYIAIGKLPWFGIEHETKDMVECIEEYFEV